jgi:PEP-CTERM motif
MKKIFTIMSLVAVTTMLHAQGFIVFNGSVANITTNTGTFLVNGGEVSGTSGKTVASGTSPGAFDYALLWASTNSAAPTGGAGNAAWSLMTTNGGGVGSLIGNNGAAPGGLTGPGTTAGIAVDLAAGTGVDVMLVGWSASLGSSWAQVLAQLNSNTWIAPGFFGETTVSTMTPFATAGAGDPAVFTTMYANGSLVLYAVPVPEPTTIALASLGGLSLLAFRRRNKA